MALPEVDVAYGAHVGLDAEHRAPVRFRLRAPGEEVLHGVVQRDGGRRRTGDVEVDFAVRPCELRDRGSAYCLWGVGLPEHPVVGAVDWQRSARSLLNRN
jgi:hypothetical protein